MKSRTRNLLRKLLLRLGLRLRVDGCHDDGHDNLVLLLEGREVGLLLVLKLLLTMRVLAETVLAEITLAVDSMRVHVLPTLEN